MTVVVSSSLVLSDTVSGGGVINANNPLIGYQNRVTAANVSATTEVSGNPASNLANPSTNLRWQASEQSPAADEFITLDLQTNEDVDYIAIARHNLHTGQIAASVEVLDETTSPDSWNEIVSPVLLPNDGPALFQFTPQAITQIRVRLQAGLAAPYVAVLYAGKLLQLQRRVYVGHTPINFGRQTKVVNSKSESGDFLGRIVLSEMVTTSVDLQNLTPAWYRAFLDPFIEAARSDPFFFAWRPSDYPREIGYCWLTNDPQPSNQLPNGLMSISLEFAGIASEIS